MSKIYSDVHISGQFVYDNNPKAGHILVSDVDGIISFATPSVYYAAPGLTLSGSTFSLVSVNTKRIYVSVNGSDSNDGLTDATPFRNIKAGRDLAVSGDTVIVMPGTYIYDNRTTNGNYWNSRMADINLWKNGVTYYFEPGSKIIFYNQTVIGASMELFRPSGLVFETCSLYGYLEYEQYGTGLDTTNGYMSFFNGVPVNSVDVGYTGYFQLKSLYTESNAIFAIDRGSTASGNTKVTIEADSCIANYVSGQSGNGYTITISGVASGFTQYYQNIRYIKSTNTFGTIQFRRDISYTAVYIKSDVVIADNYIAYSLRLTGEYSLANIQEGGIININVKKTYFRGGKYNICGSVVQNTESGNYGFKLNLIGDCIEYNSDGNAKTIFYIYSASSISPKILNFVGNIYTITTIAETAGSLTGWASSGIAQGRRIAYARGVGTIININGDIEYKGSLVTLREMFKTNFSGVINYTGNIKGNFGCPITKCSEGEINISNSTIISNIDSTYSSVISNGYNWPNVNNGGDVGYFGTGKIKISNSYIKLKNSNNYIGDGGYLDVLISNSTIINSGATGSGIRNQIPYYADSGTYTNTTNSTPTGTIQLINSTISVDPVSNSLYYTNTTAISANSITNAIWTVSNGLKGSIDIITELQY